MSTRLDDHDRLGARRYPCGGHELAGVLYRFDVQQDRACTAIEGKEIEKVAGIHVKLITDSALPTFQIAF